MTRICCNCGTIVDCFNGQMVMLKNSIWEAISPDRKAVLCLSCIEERLGRSLISTDLMYNMRDGSRIPVNVDFAKQRGLVY